MSLKIACIGGGSGLSAVLSGIKHYADLETDRDKIIDLDSLAANPLLFLMTVGVRDVL